LAGTSGNNFFCRSRAINFFDFFIRLQTYLNEIHGISLKKKWCLLPAKNKKIFFFAREKFPKKLFLKITGEIFGHRPVA